MTLNSGQSKSSNSDASLGDFLQELHETDWGRLLSLLVARTRRLDLAEDALSGAFALAMARWGGDGIPANPTGWLYTTSYRRILGLIRRETTAGRKAPLLAVGEDWMPIDDSVDELPDERLQLILLCCHPALSIDSRSALALRLVMGVPTEQIARLFLVSTPTMAARLTRAKRKIVAAGIPLNVPVGRALSERLDEVCRTVYLAFTAGYSPGSGPDLLRPAEAGEAVRLAELLLALAPNELQVRALVALLKLQHSRRDARAHFGHLVTLGQQDRTRWKHDEIQEGLETVGSFDVLRRREEAEEAGTYGHELRLQALIAAEHGKAKEPAHTDWHRIASLYAELELLTGSPIVRLNRAVAIGEADGPLVGLALLEGLDELLGESHRLYAVRADLERRAELLVEARTSYSRAIESCSNDVERTYLERQLAELGER